MSDDLTAWLLNQLAVDETRAQRLEHHNPDEGGYYSCPATRSEPYGDLQYGEENCHCGLVARRRRALAECDTKRRISEMHLKGFALCGFDEEPYPCAHLRLLALPYADRDGYLAQWGP